MKAKVFFHTKTGAISWGGKSLGGKFEEWREMDLTNYECNIELAAIVRELCAAYNHPLPQASLDRSDSAIAKARGEK